MEQPLSLAQQARVLKWAFDRGLATEEEVGLALGNDAATLAPEDLAGRFTALFVTGRLKDLLPAALNVDQQPTELFCPASGSLGQVDAGPAQAAMDPEDLEGYVLPRDGRYVPLAFLGDGGMGRVYKAFDKQLKRTVALKFLKRLDSGPVERFLQEGRSQAQIDHPHVCNIYAVEEHAGQPFLSMRFIAGPTLKEALPLLSLEDKTRIIMEVAQALHSCHRQGVVHRDIKPTNIMLERREGGAWWPYLMDFGLAREMGLEGVTIPGMLLGTPIYCSPEQVQGRMQDVDRRSDVYSLGATLYECLSGSPPLPSQGSLLDLVHRISEEEPVPLGTRVPTLPKDLQTIVMKTLEKDPGHRYDSARAFAEDLRRFLDGDPILAHSTSLAYRLAKRFRKNRTLAYVALISAVLVVAFLAFGVTMAWRGRVQTQAAQHFGREAERLEAILLKAYSLPLHDVRPEKALVQARLDRIQASLDGLGPWRRPAAHLALGRGYLALDRLEEARRELELATGGGLPRDPDTALALGLTLTRLYQGELEGLRGAALEDKKKECEASLRQPALACLRRARGAQQDGPVFVEGVLAMVEERHDDAILKAKEYQKLAPWAFEAWILEADAYRALAAMAAGKGDFPKAEDRLAQAGEALAQAQTVARSAPLAYLSEVQRRQVAYQMRLDRGRASEADRDWALAATTACLQANPEDWKALGYRAAILRRWGADQMYHGANPLAWLDAAILAAEEGLKYRPTDNPLWNNLGSSLRNRAEWESAQGQDPTRTLGRAVEALRNALARPQFKDWLLDSIGCCQALLVRYQVDHGADPTQAGLDAESSLNQAAALKPWVGHCTTLGLTYRDLAEYQAMRGSDSRPFLDKAVATFETALQLNAHSHQARTGMASVLLDRAAASLDRGASPTDDARRALPHLEEALNLNAGLKPVVGPALARAHALLALGLPPKDPGRAQELKAAREALGGAHPNGAGAMAAAEVWLLLHRAEPGGGAAAAGLTALKPAQAAMPWYAGVFQLQGQLLAAAGRTGEAQGAFAKAKGLNANYR